MKMLTKITLSAVAGLMLLAPAVSLAQAADERAYTEGNVVVVSNIRTEPGQFDNYMKYLSTTYKALMDEYKKAGIVVDYGVYSTSPTNPSEPDLLLTVTYKNLGAMDNLDAKQDPIGKKVWGSLQASSQASADRGKMRKQLGTRMLRQLVLK